MVPPKRPPRSARARARARALVLGYYLHCRCIEKRGQNLAALKRLALFQRCPSMQVAAAIHIYTYNWVRRGGKNNHGSISKARATIRTPNPNLQPIHLSPIPIQGTLGSAQLFCFPLRPWLVEQLHVILYQPTPHTVPAYAFTPKTASALGRQQYAAQCQQEVVWVWVWRTFTVHTARRHRPYCRGVFALVVVSKDEGCYCYSGSAVLAGSRHHQPPCTHVLLTLFNFRILAWMCFGGFERSFAFGVCSLLCGLSEGSS